MCLIFYKPKTAKNYLTFTRFKNAAENNPHSIGIAFKNDEGKVEICRYVNPEKGLKEIYDKIKDREEFAVHFRYATHGGVNLTNCHPFIVNEDLCLMHNGVMSEFGSINENQSDTKNFTEYFLRPYIKSEGIGIIKDKQFIEDVGKVIGSYNKLLLIDKDFNCSIINESSGVWKEGCWLSNSYSTDSSRSYYDSYSYNSSKRTVNNPYNKYNYYDDYMCGAYGAYDGYDYGDEYDYYDNNSQKKSDQEKYEEVFGKTNNDKNAIMEKVATDAFGYMDDSGNVFTSPDE